MLNDRLKLNDPVQRIADWFDRHGDNAYDGIRREAVTTREHALQCAQLAEWAHASTTLVAAALLHDIGHFIAPARGAQGDEALDDLHELRAVPFLTRAFGAAVAEPVRLHVLAKRYLVAHDPRYAASLSPASVHSLALQGGPMPLHERRAFEALPFATDALALRRWDDLAKSPGKATPPLGYYLALLGELRLDVGCRQAA